MFRRAFIRRPPVCAARIPPLIHGFVTGRGRLGLTPAGLQGAELAAAPRLVLDHFIDAASQLVAAERIVSLVDDELKLLEAANEDPLASSIRVDGSIEENVALLEPDVGQIYVEELDRLGLLKVVAIWRRVHQQSLRRRPGEGNPIGEHELT